MIVKQVTLRRLWNLGNYENIAVELTAEVGGGGEDPKEVLTQLRAEAELWRQKQPR